MTDDIPAWVTQYVNDARALFGVGPEWSIEIKINDRPGGREAWGYTVTNPVYLNATIEFARDLQDDEEGREAIYHEVLHVAHAEVWRIVSDKGVGDECTPAIERFITRVTRAILRTARAKDTTGTTL